MKRIVIMVINKLLGLFPSISAEDLGDITRKTYYESGKLESETPLVNWKEHGISKGYFENGQLKFERPYKNEIGRASCRERV